MSNRCRSLFHAFALVLSIVAFAGGSAFGAQTGDVSLPEWSDAVWKSARSGDGDALAKYFDLKPQGFEDPKLARLREGLNLYRINRATAASERASSLEKALVELQQHLKDDDLSQALRSAVEFQTLAADYDDALMVPEVQDVIGRAALAIPQARADHDWLYAQELLFRLRTLYDDTSRLDLYEKYDLELKELNQRVAFLQDYAPERLWEQRNRLAARLGEDPLPAFNPATSPDWRERVRDVNESMVKVALRATAYEHIEANGSDGWRPLLEGGLRSLETLATTEALGQTFPGIADSLAVDRFTGYVDEQLQYLSRTPDSSLQYRHLESLLSGLTAVNEESIMLPREVLLREFGDGAMNELSTARQDDYSAIIWPDEIRRFRQQTEGNFVGVGIIIRHNDRRDIVVVNPIEGTPAFRAGVRPDDVIIRVGEDPVLGWSLNDAVDRITGKEGTAVQLWIQREGADDLIPYTMVREEIKLASVKGWRKVRLDEKGDPVWDWMIDPVNRIGYIRLTSFAEDTYDDLFEAWSALREDGVNGLILDLRHNPGGLLDQAAEIANMFVPRGDLVSIEGKRPGDRERMRAEPGRSVIADEGVPVVVLVNKGSASASEIVSGALQAHGSAVIVGTRTWGKGSVQRVFGIDSRAQLKLTTQYYRLPAKPGEAEGRIVHKRSGADIWGVDPDITVDMTPAQIVAALDLRDAADAVGIDGELAADRPDIDDLIEKGLDPQLETALLILQARSVGQLGVEHARLR